jgi:DNA repair protein RAD16
MFKDLVLTKLQKKEGTKSNLVCAICNEIAEDPILSKCKHIFCREDAREYILSAPDGQEPLCPTCYKTLTIDLSQVEMEAPDASKADNVLKQSIINSIDFTKWRSSTKIEGIF